MRRYVLLIAGLFAGLLAPIPAAAGPIYLALGDSSAFGETDRTRNPSNGDRGYVAPFANFLSGRYGGVRPTVLNLAIDGETSRSFGTGVIADRASPDGIFHNTNYAQFAPNYPSQRQLFLDRVQSELGAGNTIDTVTVQLGANDLFYIGEAPGFLDKTPAEQQAAVAAGIGQFQANYAGLLTELRALLPDAELYLIGYANPFAATPEHPFHALAPAATGAVNAVVAGLAPAFGGEYVDFYTPFLGHEAEWTLIREGYNVHPNDAGYAVQGQLLIQAASTPEPSSLVLLALGAGGAIGFRRVPRRRAA